MRLTDLERRLITFVQYQPRLTVAEIAKRLNCRSHRITYSLKKLTAEGVIQEVSWKDYFRVGLVEHGFYFSLVPSSAKEHDELLDFLQKHPRVIFLAELGGSFEYLAALVASQIGDVNAVLSELSARFGRLFRNKSLSVRNSISLFGRRYLADRIYWGEPVTLSNQGRPVKIDLIDNELLRTISSCASLSGRQLAAQLGLPKSTVEERLQRLMKNKVLLGFGYHVFIERLGLQTFRLLIATQRSCDKLHQALFAFGRAHPEVFVMMQCLGSWDYELIIEAAGDGEAFRVKHELQQAFKNDISTIDLLPALRQLKHSSWPAAIIAEDLNLGRAHVSSVSAPSRTQPRHGSAR